MEVMGRRDDSYQLSGFDKPNAVLSARQSSFHFIGAAMT